MYPCVTWGENPFALSNVALSNDVIKKMHLRKNSFSYGDSPRWLVESVGTSETECDVSVLLQIVKIKQDWGGEE